MLTIEIDQIRKKNIEYNESLIYTVYKYLYWSNRAGIFTNNFKIWKKLS